jgi:hypothetical protein
VRAIAYIIGIVYDLEDLYKILNDFTGGFKLLDEGSN